MLYILLFPGHLSAPGRCQGAVHVHSELLGSSFHLARINYEVCCYDTGFSGLSTLLDLWWPREKKNHKVLIRN